jgi:acyl-CoA reductase-like NAD-dependent aldehyde dehydrogenase
MPTARPRYQITETPAVARALDKAAKRWPHEARSKLLLRLVDAGEAALDEVDELAARRRREAINASSGKYDEAFSSGYLAKLRRDWPQ